MDKKQKPNVGAILANMGKSFFSKAYWIPAFAGMTNTGILQSALSPDKEILQTLSALLKYYNRD